MISVGKKQKNDFLVVQVQDKGADMLELGYSGPRVFWAPGVVQSDWKFLDMKD